MIAYIGYQSGIPTTRTGTAERNARDLLRLELVLGTFSRDARSAKAERIKRRKTDTDSPFFVHTMAIKLERMS